MLVGVIVFVVILLFVILWPVIITKTRRKK